MEEAKFVHPAFTPVQPISAPDYLELSEDDLRLTEDDLPYSEELPMESERHVLQMFLLIETLRAYWADRDDVFVGCDMFVYFSPQQVKNHDFRGPDVLVAQGVEKRERKSWVTWQEGKPPDVVIELTSESTGDFDKGEKKRIYQDHLKAPEYFWYDPFSEELAGFALREGVYEPIQPDEEGGLFSRQTGLTLRRWEGEFSGVTAVWLRWARPDGAVLPTGSELAEAERQRVEEARQRAEEERQRAETEKQRAEEERRRAENENQRAQEMEALLARYRERFGEIKD
ncbi:MAG TPA: Uma2 family endonuclease [Blastocatellia bacterium]|nr:Uma2 family endonuclease [Blastocatellia bacterium]